MCFQIINGSDTQRHFYYLNNEKHKQRLHYWNKINGTNREMLYGMQDHSHDQRFCETLDLEADIPSIFQSHCDVINHHLNVFYNFDHEKKYKYFLPNIIRNNGYVHLDQVPHLDYTHNKKEYKVTSIRNKRNRSGNKKTL